MYEKDQIFARFDAQIAQLRGVRQHPNMFVWGGKENGPNLEAKIALISALIDSIMGLAQPIPILPTPAGPTATVKCPHCSGQVKIAVSK